MDLPLSRLRTLIGRRLEVGGRACVIVDILEDGPQLVLHLSGETRIQPDQWGDAHRRTPESMAVPIYEPASKKLNPALADWLQTQLG